MAAKKLEGQDFRFSTYDGRKYIRISDILNTTDWSRSTIERKIIDGSLVSKKLGRKVYVLWDSYLSWCKGNG